MHLKLLLLGQLKSRFAGFFAFLFLLSCQPQVSQQDMLMLQAKTEPAAAMQLANQRLADSRLEEALHWFQQGAVLGDALALQHALQLQQRLQGRLGTAYWLAEQLASGTVSQAKILPAQAAELGLWQGNQPKVAGFRHSAACQLTLQPVISQQAGADTWQLLLRSWQQDTQLSQLPVCFLPLLTLDSTELNCTEQAGALIRCDYSALQAAVASGEFSQLLVIAGRGNASYNNGILQLPDNASLALLRHEFMHVVGFIDEYRLPAAAAEALCFEGAVYPNLVIGASAAHYLQRWPKVAGTEVELTAVDSCAATGHQAYRVVAKANSMRFYELTLPELYLQLALEVLKQPEQLMPVQYYFAYLARQQQDWQQWQHFMQQAALWGYPDAQQALAL